jgi:NAD(P)-dependent dehydrogenase (short-subunit alcohol dehydrogenase family)
MSLKGITMTGQLTGKTVAVTGPATGAGAAAFKVLASEGARIFAFKNQSEPAEELVPLLGG